MPTVFSHPAVALAAAPWFRTVPRSAVVIAMVCASLPDVDVLAFRLGVPYGAPLGHRGFTHSLLFASTLAALVALLVNRLDRHGTRILPLFAFFFLVIASHGFLDAMTDGGKGVGFLIPFSSERFFLPFRPIHVSPIAPSRFAERAAVIFMSEFRWVWLPSIAVAAVGLILRGPAAPPETP